MALPQTFGVDHVFGVYDPQSFVTLQSDGIDKTPALDVEVMNETGVVITDRLDDERTNLNFVGVLKTGATPPAIGNILPYNSVNYIVKNVVDDGTNNGFRRITIKGVAYQGIVLS
jgi:hypothetical protein